MISSLPIEITHEILKRLDLSSLLSYGLVNKEENSKVDKFLYDIKERLFQAYAESYSPLLKQLACEATASSSLKTIFILHTSKVGSRIAMPAAHVAICALNPAGQKALKQTIRLLGEKAEIVDPFGKSLLHKAISFGSASIVKQLIKNSSSSSHASINTSLLLKDRPDGNNKAKIESYLVKANMT